MDDTMDRRTFLRTAAVGGAAAVTATGTAAAQEGEGGSGDTAIDYGGYLDDAPYWGGPGSTVDATGQDEVTITVGGSANGNLSFEPAAVHVDTGTTVIWEWSGEGGAHNVQTASAAPASFQSEIVGDAGFTFEQTLDTPGIYPYFCSPHQGQGMLGAVAVGELGSDVPTRSLNAATPPPIVPEGPRTLAVATTIAMVSTLGLAYFFMKYGGYQEQ